VTLHFVSCIDCKKAGQSFNHEVAIYQIKGASAVDDIAKEQAVSVACLGSWLCDGLVGKRRINIIFQIKTLVVPERLAVSVGDIRK
jgi:hypothetical protein